jgi:primase-polymerase (primpol)-like protein
MPPTRPSHPETHNGDFADPPAALSSLCLMPNWVTWRWQRSADGRGWTKPPFCAVDPDRHAANNNPKTWSVRSAAVAAVLAGKAAGIGFVLTGTKIGAVDLNKCRDPETGTIDAWAMAIVDAAPDAYKEITVSGTGLRILGIANGPAVHRRFSIDGRDGAGVEIYRHATRFITVSGAELGPPK